MEFLIKIECPDNQKALETADQLRRLFPIPEIYIKGNHIEFTDKRITSEIWESRLGSCLPQGAWNIIKL